MLVGMTDGSPEDWAEPRQLTDCTQRLSEEMRGCRDYFQHIDDDALPLLEETFRLVQWLKDHAGAADGGLVISRAEVGALVKLHAALTAPDGDVRGSARDLADDLKPMVDRFFGQ